VQAFVSGLCDLKKDNSNFMVHVRDFLVQSKEFAGEADLELLYLEEKELEEKLKRDALQAKHAGTFCLPLVLCVFGRGAFLVLFLYIFFCIDWFLPCPAIPGMLYDAGGGEE
jgi:hypothetical protein